MKTKLELAEGLDIIIENALREIIKWRTDNPQTFDYRVEGMRNNFLCALHFNNEILTDPTEVNP